MMMLHRFWIDEGFPRDPSTFSEGTWALQAYMNSLQSPSEKVLGYVGLLDPFCF